MSVTSTIGLGAIVSVGGTPIDNVVDLGVPAPTVGVAESKRLDIVSRHVTKVAALIDGGEFSVTWEFSKAQMNTLETTRAAAVPVTVAITLPEGSPSWTRSGPAILTANKVQPVNAEGIMHVETTFAVSGIWS